MLDVKPRFLVPSCRDPKLEPAVSTGGRGRAGMIHHARPSALDDASVGRDHNAGDPLLGDRGPNLSSWVRILSQLDDLPSAVPVRVLGPQGDLAVEG
jgi:hypothetical protein